MLVLTYLVNFLVLLLLSIFSSKVGGGVGTGAVPWGLDNKNIPAKPLKLRVGILGIGHKIFKTV